MQIITNNPFLVGVILGAIFVIATHLIGKNYSRFMHKAINKDDCDFRVVNAIIETLKEKSEEYSSVWYNDEVQEKSIRRGGVLIMISTGEVYSPREYNQTRGQTAELKRLAKAVYIRDKTKITEELIQKIKND